jgi:hypothetical protein
MRVHRSLASLVGAFLLAQPAWGAPGHVGSSLRGLRGAPAELPNPVTPQFNDPGPQQAPPQPGNPVQQLSPLGGAGQPDSLGIR